MRIGTLTGGGDCPGLNAVIRAVVRKGIKVHGFEFLGFRYGWAGVLAGDADPLDLSNTRGILHRGGTILGTSRTNPYKGGPDAPALARESPEKRGVDPLIPRAGAATPGAAKRRRQEGSPRAAAPKPIDNDPTGT